jgi:hypothetical protein
MKQIRQLHLYIGTFFAPSIIFFALTGAFQIFNFHEEHEGRPAIPVFEKLAEIHKDQRLPAPSKTTAPKPEVARPAATPQSPEGMQQAPAASQAQAEKPAIAQGDMKQAAPQQRSSPPRPPRRKRSEPLKYFLVLMAISLISTTFLGIYMSFKYNRDQKVVWGLLILGTVLPIVLLYL